MHIDEAASTEVQGAGQDVRAETGKREGYKQRQAWPDCFSPSFGMQKWRGGSVTDLQQQLFSNTKRYCKTKAGERGTKEAELVQQTLAEILNAHKNISVQKPF